MLVLSVLIFICSIAFTCLALNADNKPSIQREKKTQSLVTKIIKAYIKLSAYQDGNLALDSLTNMYKKQNGILTKEIADLQQVQVDTVNAPGQEHPSDGMNVAPLVI